MASVLKIINTFGLHDTIEVFLYNPDKYATTVKIKSVKGFYIYGYGVHYARQIFDDVSMSTQGNSTPLYLRGEYFVYSTRVVLTEKFDKSSTAIDNWKPF